MKREAYDKVTKWKKTHDGTMAEAFTACKVSGGTYYAQKKAVESSKRPTYDMEIVPQDVGPRIGATDIRPGMVALVGLPEDVARMLMAIGGGR